MSYHDNYEIKEIIVVTLINKENIINETKNSNQLDIVRMYLIVFVNKIGEIQDGKFQKIY